MSLMVLQDEFLEEAEDTDSRSSRSSRGMGGDSSLEISLWARCAGKGVSSVRFLGTTRDALFLDVRMGDEEEDREDAETEWPRGFCPVWYGGVYCAFGGKVSWSLKASELSSCSD